MLAELEGRLQIPAGKKMALSIDLTRLLFFDPDTKDTKRLSILEAYKFKLSGLKLSGLKLPGFKLSA